MTLESGSWTLRDGRSVHVAYRSDVADRSIIESIIGSDEYGMSPRSYTGWALDIGAHVGSWTLKVAMENPDLRIVAVETVPSNIEVMAASIRLNDLGDRVTILHNAAGAEGSPPVKAWTEYFSVEGVDPGYVRDNRYVGNVFEDANQADVGAPPDPAFPVVTRAIDGTFEMVDVVSLEALMARFGMDEIAVVKIDCEGCEYPFLRSPALASVAEVVGEWHDGGQDRIRPLFAATHDFEVLTDMGGTGTFRATRRGHTRA